MPDAEHSEASQTEAVTAPSSTSAHDLRWNLLLGIAFLVALALYLPSVWFGVVYDDRLLLMTNPLLRSWSDIPFFFKHHMFASLDPGGTHGMYYRPIVMTVLIVTTKLLGVKIWAYHLMSVLLFLAMIPSVFFLALELGFSRTVAGWTALLFAAHPMHIEVVAWATGQADTIAAIPFVLALAFYRRAQRLENAGWTWFAASALAYALALLAKESVIVIPVLALLLEIIWRAAKRKNAVIRLATMAAITAAYLVVRVSILGEIAYRQIELSKETLLRTIPWLLAFDFRQLAVPLTTSLFYDVNYVNSFASLQFILPAAILLAALVLFVFAWRRRWLSQSELFCCIAIFICLAPLMDLRVFRWRQFAHDRFLYLPSFFFLALLASLVWRMAKLRTLILCGFALFLGMQTEAQVWNFHDEFTAFNHACEVAPKSLGPLVRMATLLTQNDRLEDAKRYYRRIIQLPPQWTPPDYDRTAAYHDLAALDYDTGNFPEAEQLIRNALALEPNKPELHAFLAQILEREGKIEEAQRERQLAQPDSAK